MSAVNPMAILRLPKVLEETGSSTSEVYRRIAAGTFPRQVRLGAKSVGWRRGDIDEFLKNPAGYRAPEAA
ncbi:AlpA family phage regulatory protein [Paraburkholderia sp. BL17N1]|uniref:helix-turn-helix transcriptional regulator n=1 Tax=Paraburkholderia sp. BL17N1 TaxID=1938798 RepID=UPI000EAD76E5|nr:AlpA family phage regulatory protein [Paraburkholderia sp. BL17N1]RKR44562.1 AlpA family transcriptional regulator [Paraburkholderia sp. BL17N1]